MVMVAAMRIEVTTSFEDDKHSFSPVCQYLIYRYLQFCYPKIRNSGPKAMLHRVGSRRRSLGLGEGAMRQRNPSGQTIHIKKG